MIGFAITLLIVSLEVPRTFDDLMTVVRGFAAFAISFAIIMVIWHEHDLYFRRYGLHDGQITVLNAVLLFLILFYVYPLKFLVVLTVGALLGDTSTVSLPTGETVPIIRMEQLSLLLLLYAIGWTAVFAIFGLFYLHALNERAALGLSDTEVFLTRAAIIENALAVGVGTAAILLALVLPPSALGFAGWIFLLMFPINVGMRRFKRAGIARLSGESSLGAAAASAVPPAPAE